MRVPPGSLHPPRPRLNPTPVGFTLLRPQLSRSASGHTDGPQVLPIARYPGVRKPPPSLDHLIVRPHATLTC